VPLSFDDEEHRKLVKLVRDRLDSGQQAKRERLDFARRAYKQLRAYLDAARHPFPTRALEPKFFADMMSLVGREVQALFQSERLWEYRAVEDTEPELASLATANADRHLAARRPRAVLKEAILSRRLAGTAYLGWDWRTEEAWTCRWQDVVRQFPVGIGPDGQPILAEFMSQEWVEGPERTVDSPWFEFIPLDEAFPDWTVPRLWDGGRYFIHRTWRDREWVEETARREGWDEDILARALDESGPADFMQAVDSALDWQRQVGFSADVRSEEVAGRKWFEIARMIEPGFVTVVLNEAFVVSRRRNPYGRLNVLHLRNYVLPNEHFGMGDFEIIEKLLVSLQNMRNASETEALLSVFTPVLVRPGAEIRTIQYKPMAIWKGRDPADITYLPRPSQGVQIAEQQQQSARIAIDQAIGSSDMTRGALPQGDQKATGLSLAMQGGGVRLQDCVDDTNDCLVVPLGDAYHQMVSLWQSRDYLVRPSPGLPPQRTNIERLRTAKLRAVPTTSSAQMAELHKKRLLELHALAVQTQEPSYKRAEGFRRVAETVVPDAANRLVKTDQEMQQERQQAEQAAMQGMQLQQAQQAAEADQARGKAARAHAQALKARVQAEDALSKSVNRAMGPGIEQRVIEPPLDDVSELSNLIGGAVRL